MRADIERLVAQYSAEESVYDHFSRTCEHQGDQAANGTAAAVLRRIVSDLRRALAKSPPPKYIVAKIDRSDPYDQEYPGISGGTWEGAPTYSNRPMRYETRESAEKAMAWFLGKCPSESGKLHIEEVEG